VAEYVRAFSVPGALRAGFDDYRASFPTDASHDDADFDAGKRVTQPLLALWGDTGLPSRFDVLTRWKDYATDVRGGAIANCGHFLAEERPAELVAALREFFPR
jgi:pimeloyl-ACP methyl ester carboxylesterase